MRASTSDAAAARRIRRAGALGFGAAAAVGALSAWGFCVDDALISARVARHLATGAGYRFNASGGVVDAVTPLGWAPLLSLLGGDSPWQLATRASVVGAVLWVLAAAELGRRCAAECQGWRLAGIGVTLATCLPLGAWAVSGMETALVMALGVLSLAPSRWGAACAGIAAAWRPELVPWAVALSFGQAIARRASPLEQVAALALALGPAIAVALCRQALFGHPAPLAVFAKPSDMEHGVRYALGSALLGGPAYLLLSGSAWRAIGRGARAIGVALAVHWVTLAGVGGDWMPLWRLAMPAFPGVLLLGAALLGQTRSTSGALRFVPVFACAALLHVAQGPATRAVRGERAELIAALPPLLGDARRVASLDVGWVGAAGDYDVIDLAGVTDPRVAYLAGGHTSKRLPVDFLESREVEALVLLTDAAPGDPLGADVPEDRATARYARAVEARVMTLRGAERFARVGSIPLGTRQAYVVWRRTPDPAGTPATSEASPEDVGHP